jgi:hypothetical protein
MPEELVLPGIDNPAPAAPAVPAEDFATQSASVDTGTQVPTDDAPQQPAPEEIERKRESRGVQKRIDELTARERAAEARAERNQALVEQMIRQQMQPQQPQVAQDSEAPPQRDRFASWEEYQRAENFYIARQAARQELAQRDHYANQQRQAWEQQSHQATIAQATEQLHGITATQMTEAASRFPDFVDVIESCPADIPVRLEAAMALSGAAGEVGYYLAKNPRLIAQLAGLPDMALAHQVGRIANAMRTNAASVSNAPSPGRPAGNRGAAPNDYPKDATPEQHLAWEKRQQRNQAKA